MSEFANLVLVLFLLVFYLGLVAVLEIRNLLAHRPLNDGPSLFPVIPFLPAAFLGIGVLINHFASPWGTCAVVAVHLGFVVRVLFRGQREYRKDP